MKKVAVTGSVFLLLSIIVFASFAFSCGGGGGGVSAATGGNNAGKRGYGGRSAGKATITINPSQSPTLNEINWQTIDFKIKIGNRAPFTKTLNAGENINLQLSEEDGLAVGETIDIEAKITNAAGLEFEAFSGVQTLAGGNNNIVMTVGRKVPLTLASGVTVEGGATYVVLTKNGATLPKATTTETKYFRYWLKGDGTKIYDYQLSPADFATLASLTPVFKTPGGGDILCTDETIAASVAELGGRTPFAYICAAATGGSNGVVYVLYPEEYTNCKLSNDNYFPATSYNFDNTGTITGNTIRDKMEENFSNLYSISPAYNLVKNLPNLPTGKQVKWYIPTVNECQKFFKTEKNAVLTAIGSKPFDSTKQYMTSIMKKSGSDWGYGYYAKPDQNTTEITSNTFSYAFVAKTLRPMGYIRIH